jgi:hypothetical protein
VHPTPKNHSYFKESTTNCYAWYFQTIPSKFSCATWWCGVDVGVLYMTAQLETPREGYDEHSSKSSLSCETKVYRTSRRKNQTSEGQCLLALQ